MSRRSWMLMLATGLLAVVTAPVVAARSQALAGTPVAPGGPDLQTTLDKGLRLRRPVEFAFTKQVVSLVNAGTLPRAMVEQTFLWARKKRPFPFPYFQQAMREQAKKRGVTL